MITGWFPLIVWLVLVVVGTYKRYRALGHLQEKHIVSVVLLLAAAAYRVCYFGNVFATHIRIFLLILYAPLLGLIIWVVILLTADIWFQFCSSLFKLRGIEMRQAVLDRRFYMMILMSGILVFLFSTALALYSGLSLYFTWRRFLPGQ
jgi:hypothetical protein